jgi:hypothetical protein
MAEPAYFAVAGTNAQIRLTKNYSAIAADLGLTGESVIPISGKQVMNTGVLLAAGELGRIRINVRNGKKRSGSNIVCATDKMDDATKTLSGKAFGTGIIRSARFPRRAVFY